jgi:hypothetical protein
MFSDIWLLLVISGIWVFWGFSGTNNDQSGRDLHLQQIQPGNPAHRMDFTWTYHDTPGLSRPDLTGRTKVEQASSLSACTLSAFMGFNFIRRGGVALL